MPELLTEHFMCNLLCNSYVCKTKKFWWVRGYSNLSYGQLPDWKTVAKEIYGEDWEKR